MKLIRPSALLACAVSMLTTISAHAQWSAERLLSSGSGSIYGEAIAATGNTVHVAYGNSDIRYRRSTDQGATWSNEVVIGSGTLHLTDPMVADGSDVWIIYLANLQNFSDWCCVRDGGEVWMRRSRDGGDTWDTPVLLSADRTAFRLSIAYAANRLHVVWMDYRDGAWDTYYRRSPDRGDSWDAAVILAESMGVFGAERPQVAARGDSVHVTIWDDRANNGACMPGSFSFTKCPDVFHVRSVNGGTSWGPLVNVANGGTYFAGRNDVAVAGTSSVVINFNVDVQGETGSKLFAVASQDDGATWATPIRLTTSANASDHGSIIGGGDAVYLVWHDDRNPSNREVYYRRSPNGGLSWDAEEQVSPGVAGDSSTPLNAVTPGHAHVIWIDDRGSGYQVYYRRRDLAFAPAPDGGVPDAGGGNPGGPLAWWRMDETTGTAVSDSSGNGHDGTLVGGGTWTTGNVQGALDLDGTQAHVAVPAFAPPSSMTLEAWIRPAANAGQDSIILNKHNAEYDFRIAGDGRLMAASGGVTLADTSVNFYASPAVGAWHHVAYVRDATAQQHALYIDGAVVASGANTASIPSSSNALWIGRHSQFDFGTFQGALDEVKIHDRALSGAEVLASFNGQAATASSSSSSSSSSASSASSSGGAASSASAVASSASAASSSGAGSTSAAASATASTSTGGSSSSAGASSSASTSSGGTASSSSGTASSSSGAASSSSGAASSSSGGNGGSSPGGCACEVADATPTEGVMMLALLGVVVVRGRRRGR